jgi:hypothetical protein
MVGAKPSDKVAFESLIRSGRRQNKIEWVPVAGQGDRDALNAAIRKASGRGEPEPGEEPQSYPWKTISTLEGDK